MHTENYIKSRNEQFVSSFNLADYNISSTLYSSSNNDFNTLLTAMQSQLNFHFKEMNRRLKSGRYLAEDSRQLLNIIDDINTLIVNLRGTKYEIEIDKSYEKLLALCEDFLQSSYGSDFPEEFKKIEVIESRPIFKITQHDTVTITQSIRYELKPIGSGSYADVFKYHDLQYNKPFVVKRAKKNISERDLERFKTEFEVMNELNSPYVIDVYKYNHENNEYTMEYADYTLKNYIDKRNSELSIGDRASIVRQILRAFEYIHSKEKFHRDINPKNVLIKDYDGLLVVKISDFGLVKIRDSNFTNLETEAKGFFNDPALELRGEFKNYKIWHEIYALTRLIYFVLTGKTNIGKEKNEDILEFFNKGTANDSSQRYKDVSEMKIAFDKLVLKL